MVSVSIASSAWILFHFSQSFQGKAIDSFNKHTWHSLCSGHNILLECLNNHISASVVLGQIWDSSVLFWNIISKYYSILQPSGWSTATIWTIKTQFWKGKTWFKWTDSPPEALSHETIAFYCILCCIVCLTFSPLLIVKFKGNIRVVLWGCIRKLKVVSQASKKKWRA